MKRFIHVILIVLMLLGGFGLLLYPTVSNWIEVNFRQLEIGEYQQSVEQMDPAYVTEELEKARVYNDALIGSNIEDPFISGSGIVLPDNYTSILNFDAIMGHIKIPSINVSLPIGHGTSEEVLKQFVGHLENTAFPIGGKGYHSVLTGHTGLTKAKLFTDLDKLVIGDVFYISVLDQTLTYKVDQILVVEPHKTEALQPVEGEDYVTLVTCTPYGVNSHRLFVRGSRIPYTQTQEIQTQQPVKNQFSWWPVIITVFIILLAITRIIIIRRRRRRRKKEMS